jgi:hypothetical protein
MNPHFIEMLSALSAADTEFMVVGAHALAVHGTPRATGLEGSRSEIPLQ